MNVDQVEKPLKYSIAVNNLQFDYGAGSGFKPVLKDITFNLPKGE
jgi:ABC-type dipeptide/oligopeptide/nickel transport system ATPase subunit